MNRIMLAALSETVLPPGHTLTPRRIAFRYLSKWLGKRRVPRAAKVVREPAPVAKEPRATVAKEPRPTVEPFVRLTDGGDLEWSSQKHFRAVCGAGPDAFVGAMQSPFGHRLRSIAQIEAALALAGRLDILEYFRLGIADAGGVAK